MSISTASTSGCGASRSSAAWPVSAMITSAPLARSSADSAYTVRMSSSTTSSLRPSRRVARRQPRRHARGWRRPAAQVLHEQPHLVQQALRRAPVLEDDRLGVGLEPRDLVLAQRPAGVDHHRRAIVHLGPLLQRLQQVQAVHVGQAEIQDHAAEALRAASAASASPALVTCRASSPSLRQQLDQRLRPSVASSSTTSTRRALSARGAAGARPPRVSSRRPAGLVR